jgi:hypothetical protein
MRIFQEEMQELRATEVVSSQYTTYSLRRFRNVVGIMLTLTASTMPRLKVFANLALLVRFLLHSMQVEIWTIHRPSCTVLQLRL